MNTYAAEVRGASVMLAFGHDTAYCLVGAANRKEARKRLLVEFKGKAVIGMYLCRHKARRRNWIRWQKRFQVEF